MRKLVLLLAISYFFIGQQAYSQDIIAMEYFIDVDPGVGGATAIPITSGPTIDENFTVPTAALPVGFHTLFIRTQDATLAWSLQTSRFFYVSQSVLSTTSDVVEIEYFIDTDPGYDNGIPLPITTGTTVDFSNVINTSALPSGFHTLYIRALDSDGFWGATEFRSFYISSSDLTSQASIVAMEYFFDTDPGYGGGTALGIAAGQTVDFSTIITTSALSGGFHNIYIRALDVDGKWGPSESRSFFIDDFGNAQIDGIESFVDLDPGYSNGDFTDIIPDAASIDQVVDIPLSALPAGNYDIGLRILNTNGNYGQTEFVNVTICDGAFPDFSANIACEGQPTDFTDLSTNVLAGDTYSWDFEDDAIIDDITTGDVSFTYPTSGAFTATLTIDRAGCTTFFTTTVDVVISPTSNAGTDQNLCLNSTVMAAAPLIVGETGLWTVVSGTGTFSVSSDPTSNVSGLSPGLNEFQWEVTDPTATCTISDLVQINYLAASAADAGLDQAICSDNTVLGALALAVGETGQWIVISGTGVFGLATDPSTTVTGLTLGTNEFQWQAADATATCFTTDIVQIDYMTVSTADAGIDQNICFDNTLLTGIPQQVGETAQWTVISGSGTFLDGLDPNTSVTGLTPGLNEFSWEVTDASGTCINTDIVQINYLTPTTAFAGSDQSICTDNTTLAGNAPQGAETGLWTLITGGATITDPFDPLTTVTSITTGSIDLQWTLTDATSTCSTSDQITISANLAITAADASGSISIGDTIVFDVQSLATINPGDILNTLVTIDPTKGSATVLADGSIEYIPNAGNLGIDVFEYEICNQCGNCDRGIITTDIPNIAPELDFSAVTVDTSLNEIRIDLTALISDLNGNIDFSTLQILVQPASGAMARIENNILIIDYTGITFSGTDEMSFEVCDSSGECATGTLSYMADFSSEEDPPVIVYNAVTPNGDGKHDFLNIQNIEFYTDNEVFIYDKIGNLVFETNGYNNTSNFFNGISDDGEELANGTFYYVIILRDDLDKMSGYILLQK